MKALLFLAIVAVTVAAPLLAAAPTAEACQPYWYYCPIDGKPYYACGSHVPSACLLSLLDP